MLEFPLGLRLLFRGGEREASGAEDVLSLRRTGGDGEALKFRPRRGRLDIEGGLCDRLRSRLLRLANLGGDRDLDIMEPARARLIGGDLEWLWLLSCLRRGGGDGDLE